jgi:hypothetical protein
MARADIHIFGSVSGYSTIAASAGVRADETRELEQFQFGEISTSDAMSRLETQATMTSRMLASGRMAISRMLPAGVDDAGRPTIEVITLIVDARVYDAQLGALALLAEDASLWRDAREQVRTGIEYPSGAALVSEPRDPALLRILDAWMHATRTGSVAILPANAQLDVLRFVSTLDASDRRRCRWGIGINSLSSPVDVCTMMPGASTHGARAAVRPALSGQWHCAETEFAQFRAANGGSTWIPSSQMIAGATVGAVGVGDASNAFTPDATTRGGFNEQQKRALVISMIAATCATLLFVAAAGVYLNNSSGKKSSAVLAGGGSSDGGAEGGALPPLDESSRKVVWDERNTAPGAGAAAAQGTVAQAGDAATVGPPAPSSVPDSESAASAATDGASSTSTQAREKEPASKTPPADAPESPSAATPANAPEAAPSPNAPEPTVGQPSSETLEADSMNECVNRLRALQSRFESLPKWKPLDRSQPKDKAAADKQRVENADREVLNQTALQDYFQVLWDLLVLNESWSEAREEQLDNAKLVGGVLQSTKPPSSREDENIEVLEAWKQVAEIAGTWLASFAREASLSEEQLKTIGKGFADAKTESTPPAELGNQKKLARMFPPIQGPEDWQREVKSATQRLEAVPKKSKKPAGAK